MANPSIYAAFERLWQHVVALVGGKANAEHTHDDMYYTEVEINTMLQEKADSIHTHENDYDAKGSAGTALDNAKSYTDEKTNGLITASSVDTKISTHNTSTSAHEDIRNAIPTKTSQLENDSGFATDALSKSGGTMTGVLTAQNNTSYTTKQVRNIFLIADGETLPTGANGDICLVYTP